VRSGGPGGFKVLDATETKGSNKREIVAWGIIAAINNAINGEFGPLVASERTTPFSSLSNRTNFT
jgi:NCS1 family nucleobase:cation symporter-1